jgi:hypothetical protein
MTPNEFQSDAVLAAADHLKKEPTEVSQLRSVAIQNESSRQTHLRPQRQKYNEKPKRSARRKPFVPRLSPEWGRNIQALPKALELMFETGRNVTISDGVITLGDREEEN